MLFLVLLGFSLFFHNFHRLGSLQEALGGPGRSLETLGSCWKPWEAPGNSGMLWCALGKSGELRRGLGGYRKPWEALGGSGKLSESVGYVLKACRHRPRDP